MLKCQSCGGTYEDTQRDGAAYYHRCPPLSSAEIRTAIAANQSPLSAAQAAQLAALDASAPDPLTGATGVQRGDAYLASLTLERANVRDENVDLGKVRTILKADPKAKPAAVSGDAVAIAVGAGVVTVAAAAVP